MSSFGGCMWDVNDVTVWPGSSTSPPSDPRRGTVWYGLAANGASANGLAANGLLRVFRRSDFIYTKNSGQKNLDVMGFEPMTSGLEPASLTTASIGSLFENGQFLMGATWWIENFGGRCDPKWQFSKGESALAVSQKFSTCHIPSKFFFALRAAC